MTTPPSTTNNNNNEEKSPLHHSMLMCEEEDVLGEENEEDEDGDEVESDVEGDGDSCAIASPLPFGNDTPFLADDGTFDSPLPPTQPLTPPPSPPKYYFQYKRRRINYRQKMEEACKCRCHQKGKKEGFAQCDYRMCAWYSRTQPNEESDDVVEVPDNDDEDDLCFIAYWGS